jgi:hypothetical protein
MCSLTGSLDKIMYPATKWSPLLAAYIIMLIRPIVCCKVESMTDDHKQNKDEALAPMTFAERWISRLAVRAVIAKQRSRGSTPQSTSPPQARETMVSEEGIRRLQNGI